MSSRVQAVPAESDEHFMREALAVAREGLGWTSPNPLVGCVLVKDGQLIARAAHMCNGSEHAEVRALQAAGTAARGCTCYVTLEPCSHVGRQPACCEALAAAGVARVVYGCEDADPRTAGRAREVLPAQGVELTAGVLREQCAQFIDYYLYSHQAQRAFLHLKLALSLDAKLACANGASQWLSGPVSLGYAHYLRQKYDAVMVGWRTVRMDDPRLTTRPEVLAEYWPMPEGFKPRHPVAVILDPRLKLLRRLPRLRLWQRDEGLRRDLPRIVLVTAHKITRQAAGLAPGVALLRLKRNPQGQLDFAELAAGLRQIGIHSVLVEGGARLAQAMLSQEAVDKLSVVYTPQIIGAEGLGFAPPLGLQSLDQALRLEQVQSEILGEDVLIRGYPLRRTFLGQ